MADKKYINKIMLVVILISILLINIIQVSATPPLQSLDKNESTLAIISAHTTLLEAENLLLQAKKMDLKGYNFFYKIFIKYKVIRNGEKEIKKARKNIKNAETANEKNDFLSVSANTDSAQNRARYSIHNLNKVLAGKRRSNWTIVESVTSNFVPLNNGT